LNNRAQLAHRIKCAVVHTAAQARPPPTEAFGLVSDPDLRALAVLFAAA
jgi:hypothetical protein